LQPFPIVASPQQQKCKRLLGEEATSKNKKLCERLDEEANENKVNSMSAIGENTTSKSLLLQSSNLNMVLL
jgi:hypothetical protein